LEILKSEIMRKILSFLILVIVIIQFDSCKKKGTESDSEPSQFWVKVSNTVPDFTIKFTGQDSNNQLKDYSITYTGNVLNPNLKTIIDTTKNETWVLVYKSLERTDEISLQLSGNGKVYKANGFGFGEKRFIEIALDTSGSINMEDRDITTISTTINIE